MTQREAIMNNPELRALVEGAIARVIPSELEATRSDSGSISTTNRFYFDGGRVMVFRDSVNILFYGEDYEFLNGMGNKTQDRTHIDIFDALLAFGFDPKYGYLMFFPNPDPTYQVVKLVGRNVKDISLDYSVTTFHMNLILAYKKRILMVLHDQKMLT